MILNNLAVLMAERNLNITKLSKQTGISRPTLTAISKNESKMIQMDTINQLCIFLEVTPNEFFTFIPYDVKESIEKDSIQIKFHTASDKIITTTTPMPVIASEVGMDDIKIDYKANINLKMVYSDKSLSIPVQISTYSHTPSSHTFIMKLSIAKEYVALWNHFISSSGYTFTQAVLRNLERALLERMRSILPLYINEKYERIDGVELSAILLDSATLNISIVSSRDIEGI